MADELEKRLEQSSLGGTPLLKPDEQNKYLGTFKERCVAVLSKDDGQKENLQEALKKEIVKHPGGHLLINDELPSDIQEIYLQLAIAENLPFTIVNRDLAKDKSDIGVVYALDDVSGVEDIQLEDKVVTPTAAPEEKTPTEKDEKKSFFKKWF